MNQVIIWGNYVILWFLMDCQGLGDLAGEVTGL
jgi:hypothetical protein